MFLVVHCYTWTCFLLALDSLTLLRNSSCKWETQCVWCSTVEPGICRWCRSYFWWQYDQCTTTHKFKFKQGMLISDRMGVSYHICTSLLYFNWCTGKVFFCSSFILGHSNFVLIIILDSILLFLCRVWYGFSNFTALFWWSSKLYLLSNISNIKDNLWSSDLRRCFFFCNLYCIPSCDLILTYCVNSFDYVKVK